MPPPSSMPADPAARAFWPRVLLLTGAVLLARLVYLAWLCPYALVEDEAHYWEWSRRLDWSYYSKGPGIALAIWLSDHVHALLGRPGAPELAVRLLTPFYSAVGALAVAGLTRDATRSAAAAFLACVLWHLVPPFQAIALATTIDGPYATCWALACWAAWRALRMRSGPAWVGLGLALGAGFAFKYTILLLVPGLLAFALLMHRARAHAAGGLALARAWPAWALAGLLASGIGLGPVIYWNALEGWPTVKHLLGHLGLQGGDMPVPTSPSGGRAWSPLWMPEFIAIQLALLGPAAALVLGGYLTARRRARAEAGATTAARDAYAGVRFLLWCGLPVVLFYLGVTLLVPAEGNWALAGYVTWLGAGAWLIARDADGVRAGNFTSGNGGDRPRTSRFFWRAAIVYGLVAGLGMLRLDVIAKLAQPDEPVPAGRLVGARPLAASVDERLRTLRAETNLEPFVVAQHYGRASQMAFYLPGQPVTYATSWQARGRRTQYDHWPDTDLADLRTLGGRPAIILADAARGDDFARAFERLEDLGRLPGDHKRGRTAFAGYGYRGFSGQASPAGAEGGSP